MTRRRQILAARNSKPQFDPANITSVLPSEDKLSSAAKTLLKKLIAGKLLSPFKARDIYRAGWAGLETPAKTQAAISILKAYGHLEVEELSTGGRATIHYHWNRWGVT